MRLTLRALVVLALCTATGHAGNLSQQPVVFNSGNWNVHRGTDPMTDKTTCTGVYKDDFGIQLSSGDLYIHITGGLESIQLRFDDAPPASTRMATPIEKQISSIDISGSDFTQLMRASRLRTSIYTLVSGVHEDDIDLTGIGDAYNAIHNGCPGEPIVQHATAAAAKASSAATASGCSERAKVKMKIKGLSAGDIEDICSK